MVVEHEGKSERIEMQRGGRGRLILS